MTTKTAKPISVRISVSRDGKNRMFAAVEREVGSRRWQYIRLTPEGRFAGRESVRSLVEGINYAIRLASMADYQVDSVSEWKELVS